MAVTRSTAADRPRTARAQKTWRRNELLGMAAKGGHIAASEVMNVIEEYAPWKD